MRLLGTRNRRSTRSPRTKGVQSGITTPGVGGQHRSASKDRRSRTERIKACNFRDNQQTSKTAKRKPLVRQTYNLYQDPQHQLCIHTSKYKSVDLQPCGGTFHKKAAGDIP